MLCCICRYIKSTGIAVGLWITPLSCHSPILIFKTTPQQLPPEYSAYLTASFIVTSFGNTSTLSRSCDSHKETQTRESFSNHASYR